MPNTPVSMSKLRTIIRLYCFSMSQRIIWMQSLSLFSDIDYSNLSSRGNYSLYVAAFALAGQ